MLIYWTYYSSCSCSYTNYSYGRILPSLLDYRVTALFASGGIKGQAFLYQTGPNVLVSIPFPGHWQTHELPVDFSIDPKLRCRPQHVGRFLQHSGRGSGYIYGVTTASLVFHSIVLFVNNETVSCATIVPFILPDSVAAVEFKSGVFGWTYVLNWGSEYSADTPQVAS